MVKVLLHNVNHSRPAQDTLHQRYEETEAGLAVVVEPWKVPMDLRWFCSGERKPTVGIFCTRVRQHHLPIRFIERGSGYVACKWNGLLILGSYFSPNRPIDDFKTFLDSITLVVNAHKNLPCLILGDFNARHTA